MKWMLSVFSMLVIVTGFAFTYLGTYGVLWPSIFVGICFILIANIDQIESFKLSLKSVEARTRDVIAKAEGTLSELQVLAQYVAEISLSLVKRQGRLGGYNDDEEAEIKNKILGVLAKIGVGENSIQDVLKDWNNVMDFDYAHCILGGSMIPDTRTQERISNWNALRSGGLASVPSPESLREFLANNSLTNDGIEDLLLDYEYFRQHRQHRRPDVWLEREKWGRLRDQG